MPEAAIDYLPLLAELQHRFHSSIPADLDVAIPTCGDWTATELVQHLADVHRWAAGMARGVNEWEEGPTEGFANYYEACARLLRETLAEVGPDAPAKTLVGPGPASFWHRRQVHETLIHLHDLRTPLALGLDGVPAEVWADGVEEVVSMFYPRQVTLGRTEPVPYPVEFVASDIGTRWQLGDGAPVATVTAPARELDLFLWGRIGLAHVTTAGDESKLAEALTRKLTP
ncbi:hypothetical protein Back2_05620 [Nocardioides baekrokdamisoli]|uniref:Mycothiol-dependent maleylpyruvate isomerase metal-binding domain-containing protein n=1 Tax=Nocardioides baekrokdamisoli TaxID=1804624 RepID=A0A3G9IJN6_9ACTN|nr:maleylpyruvate isomerase family mycothiol-dependent enzyme [Nocardioides baekrokdamisoli]BBH16275.1 hypothetical protein Back2_05620 [Nocardioides baekrokdamisoli]